MWQFMRLLYRTTCVWNSTPPTPTRQGCWRCCYGWMWLACLGANLHRTMMNVRVVVAGAFRTEKYTHSVLVFPFTFVCPSLDKGWPWARKEKRTTYLLRTIRCVWITRYCVGPGAESGDWKHILDTIQPVDGIPDLCSSLLEHVWFIILLFRVGVGLKTDIPVPGLCVILKDEDSHEWQTCERGFFLKIHDPTLPPGASITYQTHHEGTQWTRAGSSLCHYPKLH